MVGGDFCDDRALKVGRCRKDTTSEKEGEVFVLRLLMGDADRACVRRDEYSMLSSLAMSKAYCVCVCVCVCVMDKCVCDVEGFKFVCVCVS